MVQTPPTTGLCRIRINIGSSSSSVLALSSATTMVGIVIPFSCMVVPCSRVLLLLLLVECVVLAGAKSSFGDTDMPEPCRSRSDWRYYLGGRRRTRTASHERFKTIWFRFVVVLFSLPATTHPHTKTTGYSDWYCRTVEEGEMADRYSNGVRRVADVSYW